MLESQIERYFCRKVKDVLHGTAYKFTSPNRRNVPDRLVTLAINVAIFVELKAPGKKPTAGQLREHRRLKELGFRVDVLDSYEAVDNWIKEVREW